MSQRGSALFAWLGIVVSLFLLALTRTPLGVEVNGNTNWLALGPIQIQPSEIAKLALVLWAAHVYANKDRRLGNLHQLHDAGRARLLAATGLVIFGHDLGTALVLFAILLGMLWVVGAPARCSRFGFSVFGVSPFCLATTDPERLQPHHELHRPVQGLQRRGLAAGPRPVRPVDRRLVRPGHRCQPAEVGQPARGAHRLHLRRPRRGARPGRHPAGDRPVPHHRLRRDPRRHARPPTRSSATCPSASWSGCSGR